MAAVTLQLPPTKLAKLELFKLYSWNVEIKCFTNVVDDGLNKNNSPEPDWSLSVPIPFVPCEIFWNAVDWARSSLVP